MSRNNGSISAWSSRRKYAASVRTAAVSPAWPGRGIMTATYSTGPKRRDGEEFVVRGGSFKTSAHDARTIHRGHAPPDFTAPDLGFRIVVDPRTLSRPMNEKPHFFFVRFRLNFLRAPGCVTGHLKGRAASPARNRRPNRIGSRT